MRSLMPLAFALSGLLTAACGPLEGDIDLTAAEAAEVAHVLPEVAEPTPPGDPVDGRAPASPIEDPALTFVRALTLAADEEQQAPEHQDGQPADGEGDGRGAS